jgi:hypothetical protein
LDRDKWYFHITESTISFVVPKLAKSLFLPTINAIGIVQSFLLGNRILIFKGEKFEEVNFSQSSLKLFGMYTASDGFLMFEQFESNAAKHRKIFGCLILADATAIFIQSDIQNPMRFIFDRPMLANCE